MERLKKFGVANIILTIVLIGALIYLLPKVSENINPTDAYSLPSQISGQSEVVPTPIKTIPKTTTQVTPRTTTSSTGVVSQPRVQTVTTTTQIPTTDYSTLVQDLLNSGFVQDLPKDAILNLRFYNFYTGVRQWEKSFVLKKNSVVEGNEPGDINIIISSNYVNDLKTKDACEVLSSAKANGDFGFETELSDTALAWKFKSMLKYRDCLGI